MFICCLFRPIKRLRLKYVYWGNYIVSRNGKKVLFLILLLSLSIVIATSVVFHRTQGFYKDFVRAKRFFNAGSYKKSLVYFESAFTHCPDRMDLLQYLAWNYSKVGRQNKVAGILTTMTQINSDDIESEKWLADTYYGLNDYGKAEDIYRDILKKHEDREVRRSLAEVLVWREKYSQAIPILENLLDKNQGDLKLIELLADVYGWQKEFASSIDMYNKLLAMALKGEDRKRISLKLAEVYRYNGQNEDAIKLYEKFFTN